VNWEYSLDTHIWIFAVGRGNAAFIRTGMNQGFILDMNAIDFDVAKFIKEKFVPKLDSYEKCKIAQAILSHPHGDHIQQCAELRDGSLLHPKLLTCPHDKDSQDGSPTHPTPANHSIRAGSNCTEPRIRSLLHSPSSLRTNTSTQARQRVWKCDEHYVLS